MSALSLKRMGKATAAILKLVFPPMVGQSDICDAIGYVENAGAPSAVVPDFVGQKLQDTTNGIWYRATGVTAGAWLKTTGPADNLRTQAAPVAKTTSAVLSGAEMVAGLFTGNQGGAAAATYTTDTATAIETAHAAALGRALVNGDSFEFSIINISVVAAETITLAAGATVTLVGDLTMACITVGDTSSGRFLARRTAANTYSIYRLA